MHKFILILLIATLLLTTGCQGTMMTSPDDTPTTDELIVLKQQASAAYDEKDYAGALEMYQQLNRLIPEDAYFLFRAGNIHAYLQQPQQAIENYQNALRLDPSLAKAWHNMGILQLRVTANTFVEMVQNISPNDPLYPRALQLSEQTMQLLNQPMQQSVSRDDVD
jgi:tetratricopeptide (TPR) repeat protein